MLQQQTINKNVKEIGEENHGKKENHCRKLENEQDSFSEAVALVEELKPLVANEEVDVVFCVPAIDIIPVVEAAKGTNIQVGAENMYFEESGAYTGEISPAMLVDAGVKYVVLGHSERREYFGETNEDVNKKVLKAIEHGITPIMCCGETLEQREQGVTMDFIRQQVKVGYPGM